MQFRIGNQCADAIGVEHFLGNNVLGTFRPVLHIASQPAVLVQQFPLSRAPLITTRLSGYHILRLAKTDVARLRASFYSYVYCKSLFPTLRV